MITREVATSFLVIKGEGEAKATIGQGIGKSGCKIRIDVTKEFFTCAEIFTELIHEGSTVAISLDIRTIYFTEGSSFYGI